MPYFEDFTHGLGVAYYRPEPSKSPAEWAEVFGRRTINAMVSNAPIQDIKYWARLAGSYAKVVLEQRETEPIRTIVNNIAAFHGIRPMAANHWRRKLMRFTLTRPVTRLECPWLNRDFAAGEIVYEYLGCTYGCVARTGIACTLVENETPFFELPEHALIEGAEVDAQAQITTRGGHLGGVRS